VRAKTKVHVEYEVFSAILDSECIADIIEDLKIELVPNNDTVAKKRFNEGVKSAAQYISNLMDRRVHRLPEKHPEYKSKE